MDTPGLGAEHAPVDGALLERFAEGDRAAFQRIFGCLQQEVFLLVRGMFRSAFDQEEALQEVWLHVFRMRGRVDPSRAEAFRGWVLTLARNRCLDLIRSAGRRLEIPSAALVDGAPASASPTGQAADVEPLGSESSLVEAQAQQALAEVVAGFSC